MPVYLALSRMKYGSEWPLAMRSRLFSTQPLNASGVSVTALALSADGCLPSRMRLVSRAISSSVLRMVTARQRQCGCQPVNLKSLGYRPASVSQMSVSVRTALALGVPSARICPGKSEVFSPGWRRMVWLLLSTISMPTTKSIFCQRRWSAVRYAILVSVAARRRAFIYELRYTPRPGWDVEVKSHFDFVLSEIITNFAVTKESSYSCASGSRLSALVFLCSFA